MKSHNPSRKFRKLSILSGLCVAAMVVTAAGETLAQEAAPAAGGEDKSNGRYARKSGKVKKDAPVSVETLEEVGYTRSEAEKLNTAYNVYNSAKQQAQDERVISGFGNNGGEEFLSFLQTGEALVIGKDDGWKNWYQQTTGRLVSIQNQDGSWNGHHCITSPVFCTATSLLILSVNNDIEQLVAQGATVKRK